MSNFLRSFSPRPSQRFLPRPVRRMENLSRLRHRFGNLRPPRRPLTRRDLRLVAPFIVLALLVIVGRRYVMQQVDIEGRIRRQIIPQLEQQYGTHIEVGRIESDWLSNVTLHDIVVGRDPKLPLGALFQAKTAHVHLNIIDLALHHADAMRALQSVILDAPQLYLQRDAQGQLNVMKLLKHTTGATTTRWTGFVQVNNGRLWYQDLGLHSAGGQTLLVDAHGLQGNVRLNGNDPLNFRLAVANALFGPSQTPIKTVALQGEAGVNGHWLALSIKWPDAPASLLTDYAFPKHEVVASTGRLGGQVQLAWDSTAPANDQWTAAGDVTSQAIAGYIQAVKEPNATHPLTIAQLNGPLSFNNKAVSFNNVSLVTLNTPLRASGNVALLQQPAFDLNLQSDSVDTNRLVGLWHGPLPGGISLSGGRARGVVRLTGNPQAARINGNVSIVDFRFAHPRYGTVATPLLAGVIHADGNLQAANIDADVTGMTVSATLPQQGHLSFGGLHGLIHAGGNLQSARLQADLKGSNVGATLTSYGQWHGDSLHSLVQAEGNLQTGKLQSEVWGTDVSVAHPQYGVWQAGGLHTVVQASGATQAPAINSDTTLTNVAGSNRQYGATSGTAIHLIAATNDAANAIWNGEASIQNLDASRLNLAAFSPSAAKQVRGLGSVSGRARFAGWMPGASPLSSGNSPVIKGRLQLSRATIADFALHNVSTAVSLAQGRLRLAGVQAQSELGPLLADLDTNLHNGTTKLALTSPHTVIEARRINPYLASQGLTTSGTAVGRVTVATTNRSLPGSLKNSLLHGRVAVSTSAPLALETSFDLAVPTLGLRSQTTKQSNSYSLKAVSSRLQGRGAVQLVSAHDWRFVGDATVTSTRASVSAKGASANNAWLDRLSGSRFEGLKVTTRGSLHSTGERLEPRLAGQVQAVRSVLPVPGSLSAGAASSPLRSVAFSQPPAATHWVTVANLRTDYVALPHAYELPRVFATIGGGQLSGHFALHGDALSGQVLADKFQAGALQQLLTATNNTTATTSTTSWNVEGLAYARADITGTTRNPQATVQARLYKATVQMADTTIPVDMARAGFTVEIGNMNVLPLHELSVWSNGGHLTAKGTLTRSQDTYALDLQASAHDVRAKDLAVTEGLRSISHDAELHALLEGNFHITGDLTHPRVEGQVGARLAQAYGLNIEDVTGQLNYEETVDGPRVSLTKATGHSESKLFTGSFNADYAGGTWSAKLNSQGANANRLMQLIANHTDPASAKKIVGLPFRGTLTGGLDINGTIATDAAGTSFVPQTGNVLLQTDTLLWRGRRVGVLTANMTLEGGLLHASKIELRRPKTPILNANGTVTTPEDALVTVTGVLPVAVETPDLNAQVNVTSERLPAIVDFLREAQRTLTEQGQRVAWLDRLLQSAKTLPAGLEGDFAVDSRITGSWRNPFFAVHLATLHNVRARAPSGGLQNLPAVDAAFTYSQGAVTVQKAELRLSKPPTTGVQNADSEAADEDTLLRIVEGGHIVPGGEISLDAEVLNANLSQLATWVPSLRDVNGQPALSGVLSQFSFQVGGTTNDPTVTGSITAEDLVYRKYTLDRLRVARFDIDSGQLAIRPGNLTIVKGSFQSSAASGFVSWSWDAPGPRLDGPLEVHLPLQRPDFGALAGVFIPAITNVDAKAFSGIVNVTGTLDAPQVGGEVTIDDGRFRFNPATVAFDGGITGLSGTLRFINGNQIAIEPTNILRGQLVPGASVQAAATGNPTRANSPTVTAVADKSPSKAARRAILETKATPANMTGAFTLRGDVALNLDPRLLTRPLPAMSEHRYNLALTLDHANYATDAFGGLRDVSLGLIWRTGAGAPSTSQQVRWMLAAAGQGVKKKAAGQVYSTAALNLAPEFATGFDALLRSRVTSFDAAQDFNDLPVYRRIAAPLLQDRRSRIAFQSLGFNMRDVGSGILDGTLLLDNQPSTPRTISPLLRTAQRSIATRLAATHHSPFGIVESSNDKATVQPINDVVATDTNARKIAADTPKTVSATGHTATPPRTPSRRVAQAALPDTAEDAPDPAPAPGGAAGNGPLPIRITGTLTLSQSQLAGLPAGAAGGPIALPDAPRLDMQLAIGRNVEFVTSTLRAELVGSIDINGTPHNPLVQGTVATRSGQVRFPNATARVTNGEITVAASRDPNTDTLRSRADIDATAVGRSGQYQITLTLRGPLDFSSQNTQNLRVDVTSNPPLSQDEAFAQLLGTSLRELQGNEQDTVSNSQINQTYARAVVNMISAPLFTGLERSLERALGISSVVLDYRFNEPLTVEFGKALGDRVFVSYRRSLANIQAGQPTAYTLRIDYRIKGNLQLGLQTDERGRNQITLDKTWRF